jgi:hypothetical protein
MKTLEQYIQRVETATAARTTTKRRDMPNYTITVRGLVCALRYRWIIGITYLHIYFGTAYHLKLVALFLFFFN